MAKKISFLYSCQLAFQSKFSIIVELINCPFKNDTDLCAGINRNMSEQHLVSDVKSSVKFY